MNDLKIYKKAAQKVKASLLLFYMLYLAIVAGTWFLLSIDLFALPESSIDGIVLVISLLQALLFGFLFYSLSKGSKAARILFWFGAVLNLLLLYFPVTRGLETPSGIYTWLAWAACLVIEDVLLYNVGMYLFTNHSCKIYYDHVIEIDEDDDWAYDDTPVPAGTYNTYSTPPVPQSSSRPVNSGLDSAYAQAKAQPQPAPKKLSLKARMQRLSVRLGVCVYGEMILFPILVSMFSDYFASTDLKSVFATRDIFVLCIASSFIWTIAIFFLYYASAQSKRIVTLCFGLEILVNIWYIPKLFGYYTSINPTYPTSVFLFFIVLDFIRYILIILCVSPVFETGRRSQ